MLCAGRSAEAGSSIVRRGGNGPLGIGWSSAIGGGITWIRIRGSDRHVGRIACRSVARRGISGRVGLWGDVIGRPARWIARIVGGIVAARLLRPADRHAAILGSGRAWQEGHTGGDEQTGAKHDRSPAGAARLPLAVRLGSVNVVNSFLKFIQHLVNTFDRT